MKSLRFLLTAGLVLAGASAFAAASKPETYTVVGYYADAKPSDEIFAQATAAVAQKVAGMTQIDTRAEADHRVEVLFTKGKYEVYVDALPLAPARTVVPYPAPSVRRCDHPLEKP